MRRKKCSIIKAISVKTIYSRVARGDLKPKHPGTKSPLAEVEESIVAVCIQMGKMRQPLTCVKGIVLVNDLIRGTNFAEAVKGFQLARMLGSNDFEHETLTHGWWVEFMQRHGDRLVIKRGERFACSRSDWTKLENIVQMYDVIYDEMVDARIAVPRNTPVYTDREGKK